MTYNMSAAANEIRSYHKIAELRAIIVEYKKIEIRLTAQLATSEERITDLQVMLQKRDIDAVAGDK